MVSSRFADLLLKYQEKSGVSIKIYRSGDISRPAAVQMFRENFL